MSEIETVIEDENVPKAENMVSELEESYPYDRDELEDAVVVLASSGLQSDEIFRVLPVAVETANLWLEDVVWTADELMNVTRAASGDADDVQMIAHVITKNTVSFPMTPRQVVSLMKRTIPEIALVCRGN